ncbi:MAG: VWA domain-containing protein [Gammaproteobacteria bacterium]
MKYHFQKSPPVAGVLLLALGSLAVQPAVHAQADAAKSNVLFILDGSGSMTAKIDSKPKIAIAKEVMTHLIQELPESVAAGLEVYGHRSKGDCNDIEMMSPVGKNDKASLVRQLQSIEPKGKTPITGAFKLAAEQFKGAEDETTVVLISDGKETCEGDPCALIKDLKAQGVKVRVHVVGFDVSKDERGQLICIAEAGGGKYFTAQNTSQLSGALREVKEVVIHKAEVKPESQPPAKKVIKVGMGTIKIPNLKGSVVFVYEQSSGKQIGAIHDSDKFIQLPAGTYKLQFGESFLEGLEVGAGASQEVQLGSITIPNLKGSVVFIYEQSSGKQIGAIHDSDKFIQLPAGTYKLTLHGVEVKDIVVEAGQEVEIES